MKNFNEFLEAKNISQEDYKSKSAEDMAGLYNEYNAKQSENLATLVKEDEEKNAKAIK